MFFQDLINYLLLWVRSRKWKRLFLRSMPVWSLTLAVFGLAIFGWSKNQTDLAANYLSLAEEEITRIKLEDEAESAEQDAKPADALVKSEKISNYAELLLRRVLQSEEFNSRATFLVAYDLGRQGRTGTARQMLRKIAPLGSVGYGAAHAWLAVESLQAGQQLDDSEREALLADLDAAADWEGVSPALLIIYAKRLAGSGKSKQAIELLKSKSEKHPELELYIADIAKKIGNERDFLDATESSKIRLMQIVKSGKASLLDFANLADIFLLTKEWDNAIQVANGGLGRSLSEEAGPFRDQLVRKFRAILAEAWAQKYLIETARGSGLNSLALQMLERSLQADATNPATIEAVAKLLADGGNLSEKMIAALERTLSDGTASALTHLLLANKMLIEGKTEKAIPHLEIAYQRAPNAPSILNNLAFALSDAGEDLDRALELIDRALRIPGSTAEYQASMLDTKAQILMKQENFTAAIVCFEDAIARSKNKITSRRRLAQAYQAAGLPEMAQQQLRRIQELESESDQ